VRILLLSNMYPSRERPDYGVFVQRLADALRARGHDVDEVVLRAGARGRLRTPVAYAGLAARAWAGARRYRPDVVYAHFLVPTGLSARLTGVPYVITAHALCGKLSIPPHAQNAKPPIAAHNANAT